MPKKEKELLTILKNEKLTLNERNLIEKDLDDLRKKKEKQYKELCAFIIAYKEKMEEFIMRKVQNADIESHKKIKGPKSNQEVQKRFVRLVALVENTLYATDKMDELYKPDDPEIKEMIKEDGPTVNKEYNEGTLKEDFKLSFREYSTMCMAVLGKEDANEEERKFQKAKVNEALEMFKEGNGQGLAEIITNGIRIINEKIKDTKDYMQKGRLAEYTREMLALIELHPEIEKHVSLTKEELEDAKVNMARGFILTRGLESASIMSYFAMQDDEMPQDLKEDCIKDIIFAKYFESNGDDLLRKADFRANKLKQGIIPEEYEMLLQEIGGSKEMLNYNKMTPEELSEIVEKKINEIKAEKVEKVIENPEKAERLEKELKI